MSPWAINIIFRPLGALALFGGATWVGRLITRRMKHGKLRYALERKRDPASWTVILWLTVPILILGALILFAPNRP